MVCLLSCSFKSTSTLISISAVTCTGALATALNIFHSICLFFSHFGLDIYKLTERKVLCIFLVNVSLKLPLKL